MLSRSILPICMLTACGANSAIHTHTGKLTKSAYDVLHNQVTERPFTSALLKEKREGIFSCAVWSTPLFKTKTKFDSGTGYTCSPSLLCLPQPASLSSQFAVPFAVWVVKNKMLS